MSVLISSGYWKVSGLISGPLLSVYRSALEQNIEPQIASDATPSVCECMCVNGYCWRAGVQRSPCHRCMNEWLNADMQCLSAVTCSINALHLPLIPAWLDSYWLNPDHCSITGRSMSCKSRVWLCVTYVIVWALCANVHMIMLFEESRSGWNGKKENSSSWEKV